MKAKQIVIPTLVLFVICVVISLALAGTNALTKDVIAEQSAKQTADRMKEVLPAAEYTELTPDVAYAAKDESGKELGVILITSAKGYGGDVRVMTGITPEGQIARVAVLSCADETPGLGQNATTEDFLAQFNGAEGSVAIGRGEGEADALTGATITSKAVAAAVNEALAIYEQLGGAQ